MQVAALTDALERARAELRAEDAARAEREAAAAQQLKDQQGARPFITWHCVQTLHAMSPSSMSFMNAWCLRLGVLLCCMLQMRMGM